MPRAPVVQREALPGPRVSPALPSGAFGVPASVDTRGVQRLLGQIQSEERDRADNLAVLDADNQLSKLQTDLHTQATSRLGLDAFGASQETADAWAKSTSEIEGSLRSDRQKDAFRQRVAARGASLYSAVEQHTAREYQRFAADTTKTSLDRRFDEALTGYTDPGAVETAVAETRAIIADQGRREGWSPEMVQQEQADRVSRMQVGVVGRYLAKGDDLAATAYYAKVRDQVRGADQGRLEQELDIGSVRGESQRRADAITDGAATMEAALGQIRGITDPKVRDATEERVRRFYSDKAQADSRERYQAYIDAGNIVDKTGDTHRVPPSMWNLLSPSEKTSLRQSATKARGGAVETDPDTYYSLLNMAGLSDEARHAFENLDLRKYRSKLDERDFEYMLKLQLGLRRQSLGAVAGEAKHEAVAADREAKRAADRAAAMEQLKALGIDIKTPTPGGPITRPQGTVPNGPLLQSAPDSTRTPADSARRRVNVPQSWIDHAKRDPNYRRYLEHMIGPLPQ